MRNCPRPAWGVASHTFLNLRKFALRAGGSRGTEYRMEAFMASALIMHTCRSWEVQTWQPCSPAGCCWLPSSAGGGLPEHSLQSQWAAGSSGVPGLGAENSSNGPSSYKDPSRSNFRETHSCSRAYKYFLSLTLDPRVLTQCFSTNAHVGIFELWCQKQYSYLEIIIQIQT